MDIVPIFDCDRVATMWIYMVVGSKAQNCSGTFQRLANLPDFPGSSRFQCSNPGLWIFVLKSMNIIELQCT